MCTTCRVDALQRTSPTRYSGADSPIADRSVTVCHRVGDDCNPCIRYEFRVKINCHIQYALFLPAASESVKVELSILTRATEWIIRTGSLSFLLNTLCNDKSYVGRVGGGRAWRLGSNLGGTSSDFSIRNMCVLTLCSGKQFEPEIII